jgi:hypothetical protein
VSPRKKRWGEPEYRIERYDSSWGGWRFVPKSSTSDDPATFETVTEAERVCEDLRNSSRYAYRVVGVFL